MILQNAIEKLFDDGYWEILSSKKRDLSDNSKEAADPKKAKEATSSSSYSDHNVFEEGMDSSSCRSILFDCLKNLESKVNKKHK